MSMRELEWDEDVLLAEQERVRTEGHAPAPPAPGFSWAELEHKLAEIQRYAEEGEMGIVSDALAALIDRLQQRPDPSARVPVTVADFEPRADDRRRHQREALRAAMTRTAIGAPEITAAELDELVAAVEAGF